MLPKHKSGFLALGDATVPYELRRSRRRRTLGLTVTPHQVRIHAPHWTPHIEIDDYVQQQETWLRRAWSRMQTKVPVKPATGHATVAYLGRSLKREVHASLFVGVRRRGHSLQIYAPPGSDIDALVHDWQYAQAAKMLSWRLARIARQMERKPVCFALSNAQTQWGSCTRTGRIRLNWRLIQAPLTLIDYVAAHELAHLVHLDHSPAFWARVTTLCPDAPARRAALHHLSASLFQV